MSTPLKDRIITIKNNLVNILDDCLDALRSKQVVVNPTTYKLSTIAGYIRQIFQSEYEFIMHLDDVDQFGNPHVPNQGGATGGFYDYHPTLSITVDSSISFAIESVGSDIAYGSGAYGVPEGNIHLTIDSGSNMNNNTTELIFTTVQSVPNTLEVLSEN